MIYSLMIHRVDKRCKTGLRFFGSYEFDRPDQAAMDREVAELRHLYPVHLFVITVAEKYKTVKNLVSGEDVVIAADTPRCCDPSSETYWSL